jgi:hypothetical protein
MVRAAVSGAIDYTQADPLDNRWRLKHRLVIAEVQRRENQCMLEHIHQHWCAYVSHGNLEPESFRKVKETAADLLGDLKTTVFPWAAEPKNEEKPDDKNSKIDGATQSLIERYKVWRTQKDTNEPE